MLYGEAASVNELLHAHHAAVLNDEYTLQRIPEIASQKLRGGDTAATLRGEDTPLGRDILEAFPEDFNAGTTDIVAVANQVLMMVRDRGHALTLDIDYDEKQSDQVLVRYHIPKVCNVAMTKLLPGIGAITDAGADGRFAVDRADAGRQIVDFIHHVPTDKDIPAVVEHSLYS